MKTRKEIKAAILAQARLCHERGLPHFAPPDGICYRCSRQIYEVLDGAAFVTGCPHCNRSYCD